MSKALEENIIPDEKKFDKWIEKEKERLQNIVTEQYSTINLNKGRKMTINFHFFNK